MSRFEFYLVVGLMFVASAVLDGLDIPDRWF